MKKKDTKKIEAAKAILEAADEAKKDHTASILTSIALVGIVALAIAACLVPIAKNEEPDA